MIAGLLEILLGVISILAIRGLLGADGAFTGITEEAAKDILFGLVGLYGGNIFKILAGLLGILLAGKRHLITVIMGLILFVVQLWSFVQVGNDMAQIIINIALLAIPYYYLYNAYKLYKKK